MNIFVYMSTIIDEISKILDEEGLSRDELAAKANISRAGLYKIFSDDIKEPRRSTIRSIAEATNRKPIFEDGKFVRFEIVQPQQTVDTPTSIQDNKPDHIEYSPEFRELADRLQKNLIEAPIPDQLEGELKMWFLKRVLDLFENEDWPENALANWLILMENAMHPQSRLTQMIKRLRISNT